MCSSEENREVSMPPRALASSRNGGMSTRSAGSATRLSSCLSMVRPATMSSRMHSVSTGALCTKIRLASSAPLVRAR